MGSARKRSGRSLTGREIRASFAQPALLLLVVALSGCISLQGIFGGDVLSIRTQSVTSGSRDVITLRDVTTIPSSPLLPDVGVLFSFVVSNNDAIRPARSVAVDLFNAPLFRSQSTGKLCNEISAKGIASSCLPNENEPPSERCSIEAPCDMLPGEEKQMNFLLRTLKQDEIANVRQQTRLDWKVNYDFDGSLTYILPVVNFDEILKRQRSGDKTEIVISKAHSSGPVMIDVELLGAPYMLASQPATLIFKVRNTGNGAIKNSVIGATLTGAKGGVRHGQGIEIVFPEEFEVLNWPGKAEQEGHTGSITSQLGLFSCDANICESQSEISIYKDESRVSMRFEVQLRDAAALQDVPFRSFQTTARVFYNYELRGSQDITINPFENV